MPLAYIDDTGLHLPDYPTVLDDLKAKVRAIFGEDLYLEPDSQEGQLVAIFAQAVHEAYSLAGSVYNSYSPSTAQGVGLSRMVIINGIRRDKRSHSTAPVRVVGEAGGVIKGGMADDVAGRRWLLPAQVTIPLQGEIMVTVTAQEPGDLRAAPGEINKIATPCRGWQSVSNPEAALPGAPVESDARLRTRQRVSTALPSRTVFEGTLGAVANVPGVTRQRGYENDTDKPDVNGIPPHHICMVVEGGDNQAIADAIAVKKTPGAGTLGDITLMTRDRYGVPKLISFYRPTLVRVGAMVILRALGGYTAATGERLRSNLVAHINALNIGEDVLHSRAYCPITSADTPGCRTFDVLSLRLFATAHAGEESTSVNVSIPFNGAALCDIDDITLEVRT